MPARFLKFHIWIPHEKIVDPYFFFLSGLCTFLELCPFELYFISKIFVSWKELTLSKQQSSMVKHENNYITNLKIFYEVGILADIIGNCL